MRGGYGMGGGMGGGYMGNGAQISNLSNGRRQQPTAAAHALAAQFLSAPAGTEARCPPVNGPSPICLPGVAQAHPPGSDVARLGPLPLTAIRKKYGCAPRNHASFTPGV